jgi:hypothetical protein
VHAVKRGKLCFIINQTFEIHRVQSLQVRRIYHRHPVDTVIILMGCKRELPCCKIKLIMEIIDIKSWVIQSLYPCAFNHGKAASPQTHLVYHLLKLLAAAFFKSPTALPEQVKMHNQAQGYWAVASCNNWSRLPLLHSAGEPF